MRHRVARIDEIACGTLLRFTLRGVDICIARARDGTVYAINDRCTHEGESLSGGEIVGLEVECPAHLSRFDLRTGEVRSPPALMDARTYPVTVEDDVVFVDL